MQAASPAPGPRATPPVLSPPPAALPLPLSIPHTLCQLPSPGSPLGPAPAPPADAFTPSSASSPGRRSVYDDLQHYNPVPPFVDHTEDEMLREDYNRLRARRTSSNLSSSPAATNSPSSLSMQRRSLGDSGQRLPPDFVPSPVPPHLNPVPPYLDYIEDEMLRDDHVRVRSSARGSSIGPFPSEHVPPAFPTNNIGPSHASSPSPSSASIISPSSRHQLAGSEEPNDRWSRDRLADLRRAMLASQSHDNRPSPWVQAWGRTPDEPLNAEVNDRYWDAEYPAEYIERPSQRSSSSSLRPSPATTHMGGRGRQALNRDINETVGRRLGSLRPIQMANPSFPLETSTNTLRRREVPRVPQEGRAAAPPPAEGNLWGELERDSRSSSSFSESAPPSADGDSGTTTPTQESVFRAYGSSNRGEDEDGDFDENDEDDDEDYEDENENGDSEMLNPDIMREVYNLLTARPVPPMAMFSGPGMAEPIELIHAHVHSHVSSFGRVFRQRPPRQSLEELRLSPQMDDNTVQKTLMSAVKGLKYLSDGKKRRMAMGMLENITWAEFGEREGMVRDEYCSVCHDEASLFFFPSLSFLFRIHSLLSFQKSQN